MAILGALLAVQLWYGDYQAMLGTKTLTEGHPPIEQQVFVTKVECDKYGASNLVDITDHPPRTAPKVAGMKWVFKCVRRVPVVHTPTELNEIHDTSHAHNMPGM